VLLWIENAGPVRMRAARDARIARATPQFRAAPATRVLAVAGAPQPAR